jgi:ParB family chromosome partitioning protein
MAKDTHLRILSCESNDWYTPAIYIEAARAVMGGIDLDPASCELANRTVGADHYFARSDDGLSRDWAGRVWLNPPYGRGGAKTWSRKLIDEYDRGAVSQAVLLVNASTDTRWFQPFWAYPICFVRSRIRFAKAGFHGYRGPTHASAFVYFGGRVKRFRNQFRAFGHIVLP